jgi:hypothetical protein
MYMLQVREFWLASGNERLKLNLARHFEQCLIGEKCGFAFQTASARYGRD